MKILFIISLTLIISTIPILVFAQEDEMGLSESDKMLGEQAEELEKERLAQYPEPSLSFQSVECPPGSFEKAFSAGAIVCINEATGKALKPGELTGEQQGTYVTAGIIIAIIAAGIGIAISRRKSLPFRRQKGQ